MGMWKKDAAVAVSGGSDHRQKDQKRCLDAHWLPTGQHEHFHKGQLLYALTLSLNAEGQRMRGSCKTICVLSKCPHSIHMRAEQALMEKLPRFQDEAVGLLSRISRHTEAVPGCKSPCGSAPQTGLLAEWVHLNNGPFCSSEATSPNNFPAKCDCWI